MTHLGGRRAGMSGLGSAGSRTGQGCARPLSAARRPARLYAEPPSAAACLRSPLPRAALACAISLTGPADATQRAHTLAREAQAVPCFDRALAFAEAPAAQEADARRTRREDRAQRGRRALTAGAAPPRAAASTAQGSSTGPTDASESPLPHSSYALAGKGRPVRSSRLRPGDLLFFWGLGHVGLYVGHGRMVHAPHAGERVQVVRLAASGYGRATGRRAAPALTAQRLGSSSTIPSRATTGGSSVFDSSDLASASSCSMISSEWVGS